MIGEIVNGSRLDNFLFDQKLIACISLVTVVVCFLHLFSISSLSIANVVVVIIVGGDKLRQSE